MEGRRGRKGLHILTSSWNENGLEPNGLSQNNHGRRGGHVEKGRKMINATKTIETLKQNQPRKELGVEGQEGTGGIGG